MALLTIVVLYLAGPPSACASTAAEWLTMTGLILVGLDAVRRPRRHVRPPLKPDSLGPAIGGITALFALLGGAWGPIADRRRLPRHREVHPLLLAGPGRQGRPSAAAGWPAEGWIVIAVWTAVLARLAVLAYRRDTARVS